jgi:hypothetical protein
MTTYREEQEHRAAELVKLFNEVVTHLDGAWRVDPEAWYVTLAYGDTGGKLHVATEWNKKDRITVSGIYPGGTDYLCMADNDRKPRITVAKARGAETIAKEINRRVLPVYLELFAKVIEAQKRYNEAQDEQHETARQCAALFGKPDPFRDREGYSPSRNTLYLMDDSEISGVSYADVEFREGGTVTLKLYGVTRKRALEILQLIKLTYDATETV